MTPCTPRGRALLPILIVALSLSALTGCEQKAPPTESTPKESPSNPTTTAQPKAPTDITELIRNLDNSRKRTQAFYTLCKEAREEDLGMLHAGLRSLKTNSGRWRAAWVLGEIASVRSIPVLLPPLKNAQSPYVRRTAALSLGKIGSEDALEGLEQALLHDPEKAVKQRAAWAIDRILQRDAEPILQRALKRERDETMRRSLRWLLNYEMKGTFLPPLIPGEAHYGALRDTQYKVYLPPQYTPKRDWPLLISVHGTDGHPDPYEKMWREDAKRRGFIVLAPFFDPPNFPNYDLMQLNRTRSDLILLEIVSVLDKFLSLKTEKFYLFGHSKGGQFVTRFVLLHPDRIIRAAACGSGSYVFPDSKAEFPGGLNRNPFLQPNDRVDMHAMLRVPLAIIIGTEDLDRRKAQATKFMDMTRIYAATRNLDSRIIRIDVPQGKHLGTNNQPYASRFFFSDP